MSNDRKHQLDRPDDQRLAKKPKLSENDDNTPHTLPPGPGDQVLTEDEHRRKQEELKKIEQEFTALKEKLFADKMAAIKREVEQLQDGTYSRLTAT